jgi:hypothetical protein
MYISVFILYSLTFSLFFLNLPRLNKKKILIYVLASALIALYLFPFFFLGQYSLIGGYDEQDGQIIWHWKQLQSELGQTFFHDYAGGTHAKNAFISGNEFFSLYAFFIKYLPSWLAASLFKFLGLLLLGSGIYQTSRKVFKQNRMEAICISLFGIFTTHTPYLFALGGYGWTFSILSWIPLVYFHEARIKKLYLKAFVLGLLAAISSEFLLVLPVAVFAYFVFMVFFHLTNKLHFQTHQIYAAFLTILIFCIGHLFCLIELSKMLQSSARFVSESFLSMTFLEVVYQKGLSIILILLKPPHYLITLVFFLLILVSLRNREIMKLLMWMSFMVIMVPFLLSVAVTSLGIPILGSYRFDAMGVVFIVGSPFLLMALYQEIANNNFITLLICTASILGATVNTSIALDELNERGGHFVKEAYSNILDNLDDNQDVRVLTNNYNPPPSLPLYYGLNTLDGVKFSSGLRRAYFFKLLGNNAAIHTHRHVINFSNENLNIKMLQAVNIGYILSNTPIKNQMLSLISKIDGTRLGDIDAYKFFPKDLSSIFVSRELYVYELTDYWPLVFASSALYSHFSFQEKGFYEDIISRDSYLSVFALEDIKDFNIPNKKFSMAKIQSYNKTISGLNIQLIKEGLVTINIEFNSRWKALCNGRNLEIYPSNGIMMSVDAPKGCKSIELNLL